ncbi:MAG: HDOD domain-containing protein [Deltaproteobacteria bacterium]|nr:HDOD domain-containing protein [Deltaproteobacteria bacterium]
MLAPIEIDGDNFLRQHCTLPALPEVVYRIQNMMHNENIDLDEVSELVSSDPSLVAQALKVVNSAYYGIPREIIKVRVAIALLGLNEIYRMILALSVINTLAVGEKKELSKFWYHSYYMALCTKYLAKKYEPLLSFEELWSGSILHDIGKLVYLKFFPEHFKALTIFCEEHGVLFSEAENHLRLPSSAYMGSLLCEHWRLPNQVKLACASHGLEDLAKNNGHTVVESFIRVICLGNLLTILSTEELNNHTKHEIADKTKKILNCSEEHFLAIMGDVYELKTEVEGFITNFD